MSLEPTTTAKVTLITTKGAIKIDIFAKELPSTSLAFITQCHLNKFQNVSIQVTPQYISFLSPPDQPNSDTLSIVKESHSRIKCKQRGYVAYANGQWLISRGELNQANLQVFGKIDQASSWYIVNDIANGEVNKDTGELVFPVTIENSIVDVPFFKLDLKEKEEVAQGEDEKPKAKKPKVAIDYDVEEEEEDTGVDEEEGTIRIKSAYDTEKKKKRDKAQQDEVVSQADVVPESKLMSVNEKKQKQIQVRRKSHTITTLSHTQITPVPALIPNQFPIPIPSPSPSPSPTKWTTLQHEILQLTRPSIPNSTYTMPNQ